MKFLLTLLILLCSGYGLARPSRVSVIPEGYRNISQVQSEIRKMARQYSSNAKVIEYGKSDRGLPLLALKVSDNVSQEENEPQILITAATHGDELITVEVILGLMDRLLAQASKSADLKALIDHLEIYFIPVVNPDGYSVQARGEIWADDDANRSYPYPGNLSNSPSPSISALIKFFHSKDFKGSLDLHAYGQVIMYPWSYTSDPLPEKDEAVFKELAQKMAEANGYSYGPVSTTLYQAPGSSIDYYYMSNRTLALTMEIGRSKNPYYTTIPRHIDETASAVWTFLNHFKEAQP